MKMHFLFTKSREQHGTESSGEVFVEMIEGLTFLTFHKRFHSGFLISQGELFECANLVVHPS